MLHLGVRRQWDRAEPIIPVSVGSGFREALGALAVPFRQRLTFRFILSSLIKYVALNSPLGVDQRCISLRLSTLLDCDVARLPIPQGECGRQADAIIRFANVRSRTVEVGANADDRDTRFLRQIDTQSLLLELGADYSIPNVENTTPLIVACGIHVGSDQATEVAGEEPEVLEAAALLLKLGADVNAVDANGDTAMHAAALKNLPRVVQFLADKGAKVEIWNRKNKHGWTPLSIAEGHRPGNFKPSAETIVAVQKVMLAAGVRPPPEGTAEAPKPKRGY